jgi:hypothetical protein
MTQATGIFPKYINFFVFIPKRVLVHENLHKKASLPYGPTSKISF